MPHSHLRSESELGQLDARYTELASGFMQQLAGRAVSDATLLLCTSKLMGAACVLAQAVLTRDSQDPRCICLGCIERESRVVLQGLLASHPLAPRELIEAYGELIEKLGIEQDRQDGELL